MGLLYCLLPKSWNFPLNTLYSPSRSQIILVQLFRCISQVPLPASLYSRLSRHTGTLGIDFTIRNVIWGYRNFLGVFLFFIFGYCLIEHENKIAMLGLGSHSTVSLKSIDDLRSSALTNFYPARYNSTQDK